MSHTALRDSALFEPSLFSGRLDAGAPLLALCKETLIRGRRCILEGFQAGVPVKDLFHHHARMIVQLVAELWKRRISHTNIALVAVGGFGRGELHPASDIDLMVLTPPRPSTQVKRDIERFLTFLWDVGLEIGHSVRSIRDCVREAKADVSVATNLFEGRLLDGNEGLFLEMQRAIAPDRIWPAGKFFEAKRAEQAARYRKFEDTEHGLEPNVKDGPGGLRDIQMIGWVAQRHFGPGHLHDLVDKEFLTEAEYDVLNAGRSFLWQIRFALHALTGRREDRLLFDYQKGVAAALGYVADDNSGVERFMKRYYLTVRDLSRLNEMLMQHFQEVIIHGRRKARIRPLNKRFQVHNDHIEVRNSR
ncbi:MAG: nucleotidyltransferase domain-containing protein, partial [Gammaproteobacteria bacterium]